MAAQQRGIHGKLARHVKAVGMKRAAALAEPILPWLTNGEGAILDFGCGFGHMGYLCSQKTGRLVEYYDVRNYPYTHEDVKVRIFDGRRLSARDRQFDTTLVAFVLHHVPEPAASLREIVRVTDRFVLVCEDRVQSRAEIFMEGIKDSVVNGFLSHMHFQYRVDSDWEAMFASAGLTVIGKTIYQTRYIFTFRHVAWLMRVPG